MTMGFGKGLKRWLFALVNFSLRVYRRLRFFPFTLCYILLLAALRLVELRRKSRLARVGEGNGAILSPLRGMMWLDEIGRELRMLDDIGSQPRVRGFDVCLKLSPDAADANLHDVFSVLLTSPRLKSIGFYWDESTLRDDLPLWQGAADRRKETVWSTIRGDLRRPSVEACRTFLDADHQGVVLPVAACRDAQTLIKRQGGAAYAVCLNLPEEVRWLVDGIAEALSDAKFFDIDPILPGSSSAAANVVSLYGYGLNLHERMGVAQTTDAYVGRFDEVGCAALFAGRPTVLIGGGAAAYTEPRSRADIALWLPDPSSSSIRADILEFLCRHVVVSGRPWSSTAPR
jgi:hypothetical protein